MTESLAGQTVEWRARADRAVQISLDRVAELDARILAGAVLGLDLTGMIAAGARIVTPDEAAALEGFARRRIAGEPVARIVRMKEFWGLPLQLSPATLVPRPDTETVVELALEIVRATTAARPSPAHRRHRHRFRRDPAGAAVRIAARKGVGTDISAERYKQHTTMQSISGSPIALNSWLATTPRGCRADSI